METETPEKSIVSEPSPSGYYGAFGGAYIPEMLQHNIEELSRHYLSIFDSSSFQQQFRKLLHDFAGRPTPLYHASRLSKKYACRLFFKREDLCHTGAHKINNTIGQILLAKQLNKKRIIAETGAGQHGVATASVCAMMGMECIVYMGQLDVERQAPNVARMHMLGAKVVVVTSGSKTLKDATNEAIRDWINHPKDTYYIIGSVVGPHPYPAIVTRLQSIISKEIQEQVATHNIGNIHAIIACIGGGSNAAGAFYHYLHDRSVELYAAEGAGHGTESAKTAATTFKGRPGILHGSKTLLMQTEDGQVIEPYSISAGLDYPGIGPLFAHLEEIKRVHFIAITDKEALAAAKSVALQEGIIPALETAHAIAVLEKKDFKDKTVIINLSGRGDKDLSTYMQFL